MHNRGAEAQRNCFFNLCSRVCSIYSNNVSCVEKKIQNDWPQTFEANLKDEWERLRLIMSLHYVFSCVYWMKTRHHLTSAKDFCVFALWTVLLCSWNAGVPWMKQCYFLGVALTVVVLCSLFWGTTFFYLNLLCKLIYLPNTIWS